MEFIKIAYCVTVPLLVLLSLVASRPWKRYSLNALAVTNILLIGHSVFLARQLAAVYHWVRSFSNDHGYDAYQDKSMIIHMLLVLFLPLLFFSGHLRKNRLFSLIVLIALYSFYPPSSWNTYDLVLKIPAYLCLLCAGYALFWLWNKLPYQSPVR
jgi:hypothetical protein